MVWEYTYSLQKNLEYSVINKIHILYEKIEDIKEMEKEGIDPTHEKIVLYNIGGENRLICIFKENGYDVTTPLNILKLIHWHKTDIRPAQNNNWILLDGTLVPNTKQFTDMRKKKGLIGGMLTVKQGCSKLVDTL